MLSIAGGAGGADYAGAGGYVPCGVAAMMFDPSSGAFDLPEGGHESPRYGHDDLSGSLDLPAGGRESPRYGHDDLLSGSLDLPAGGCRVANTSRGRG